MAIMTFNSLKSINGGLLYCLATLKQFTTVKKTIFLRINYHGHHHNTTIIYKKKVLAQISYAFYMPTLFYLPPDNRNGNS